MFPFAFELSLFDLLHTRYQDGLPEELASKIFYQMLNSIQFLHGNFICHNDIKCEKVMVCDTDPVKILISLSNSTSIIKLNEPKQLYYGTPQYAAPKILSETPFDCRVDIWSLGISLFIMLSNKNPFPDYETDSEEYLKKVLDGDLNYDILKANNVSEDAIDLIKSMCKVDPDDRISIQEALVHPWIMAHHEIDEGNQINIEPHIDQYDIYG